MFSACGSGRFLPALGRCWWRFLCFRTAYEAVHPVGRASGVDAAAIRTEPPTRKSGCFPPITLVCECLRRRAVVTPAFCVFLLFLRV